MDFDNNEKIKLAYDFVFNTNKNIFLTGKAGTGKTTFLRNLRKTIPKRTIVVAPTGVAAINAGGVTIHSFFQLPFTPFVPKNKNQILESGDNNENSNPYRINKLNRNKIKIIKSLDLLVIDEISMVRADLLDAIDDVLRRYRRNNKAFGGVQLLMIGDLYQLAPVIKEDEWSLIKDFYSTSYFFGSNALRSTNFITIELKHIYRQSDETFINLLGEIRENRLSYENIELLNNRYIPDFEPGEKEGYITLTTHNSTANNINVSKLEKLKEKTYKFRASLTDDFPEYMYPTEEILIIKPEAQVMFVKNDSSCDKLYYNGKIGKVTRIEDDLIYVKCPSDYSEIPVKTETWDNVKYSLNEETKEIEESVIGRFEQYPLKLAWAITIHKSQGLTFEKAIIDINAAFAFGQVYVALSRCKSLEGMVLMSKISLSSIKTDHLVKEFNNDAQTNAPDENKLLNSKFDYQKELVTEQFDFTEIKKNFYYLKKVFNENYNKFDNSITDILNNIENSAKKDIFDINDKFISQINFIITKDNSFLPQDNQVLQERIKKASDYYFNKLEEIFYKDLENVSFDSDNKEAKKTIADAVEKLERALYIKSECLKKSLAGFETQTYLKSISDADLDFKPKINKKRTHSDFSHLKEGVKNHYELYAEINSWRKIISEEANIPVYMVLPQKTLKELIEKLPSNLKQLSKIKGFGKVKLNQYGEDILEIIDNYCQNNNIQRDETEIEELKPKKAPKPDTKLLSLELFKQGKNITQIAEERGFVESTIYGHLGYYVAKGELEITELIPQEKLDEITDYINEKGRLSLRQLYDDFDRKYLYHELRLVIDYLDNLK